MRAPEESTAALARRYGVSRSTIARRLTAAPPAPPAGKGARKAPSAPATRKAASAPAPASARSSASGRVSSKPPTLAARRKLLNRLYQAIDTKLKLMERRMHSEISALDATAQGAPPDASGLSPADHERETRAFGALVKTINSVKDMQAELDRIATGTADTAADARLNADAERYRREIAERLARFVPRAT